MKIHLAKSEYSFLVLEASRRRHWTFVVRKTISSLPWRSFPVQYFGFQLKISPGNAKLCNTEPLESTQDNRVIRNWLYYVYSSGKVFKLSVKSHTWSLKASGSFDIRVIKLSVPLFAGLTQLAVELIVRGHPSNTSVKQAPIWKGKKDKRNISKCISCT